MLVEIEYADGRNESFDTESRATFVYSSPSHEKRVNEVGKLIEAAMDRRSFFDRGINTTPAQLNRLGAYVQQYAKHVKDLLNIPFDGYLTESTEWEAQYGKKGFLRDESLNPEGQLDSVRSRDALLENRRDKKVRETQPGDGQERNSAVDGTTGTTEIRFDQSGKHSDNEPDR